MKRAVAFTGSLSVAVMISGASHALPIDGHARGFREGANHHVGDSGFVAAYHREPGANDGEGARMHAHLAYIRGQLAARPATRPELEQNRQRLLGYLDEYIAKNITPKNTHLPWRTPVFIDDDGRICAVGYLIERSAGRAVPEEVARTHRYDLLEDIATAMPEVRAWIEASGFTLEELASIQPGYEAPVASTWGPWDPVADSVADGAYVAEDNGVTTRGALRAGKMEGAWTRKRGDTLLGSGTFAGGKGTWRSVYADGKTMAEGSFVNNRPTGAWRFLHPSGNVTAEGSFSSRGIRVGNWRFYYDASAPALIAEGNFAGGAITGDWRHYDSHGQLLATSGEANPGSGWRHSFGGHLLDIRPGADGVHHWVHQGNISGDHHRLDMVSDGSEPLFVKFESDEIYDADGHKLAKQDGRWTTSNCHWTRLRMAAAHAQDLVTLHGLTSRDRFDSKEKCGAARPISVARAHHIEAMSASLVKARATSPEFVRKLSLGETNLTEVESEETKKDVAIAADLAKVLASNMTWYVEWPHVDGRFIQVFQTLPGYSVGKN